MKYISAIIGIFFLILFSGNACAVYDETADDTRSINIESIADELGLTAEQKEVLLESQKESRSARETQRYKIREKRRELRQELEKTAIDQKKIDILKQELKTLEAAIIDQRVSSILKVKRTLSPEQFERFQAATERQLYKATEGRRGKKITEQDLAQ